MFRTFEGTNITPSREKRKPADRTVLILGASDKPARYGNMAFRRLSDAGFNAIPVNPRINEIDGVPVYPSLGTVDLHNKTVDTLTVYLSPEKSATLGDEILRLAPRRVIFNPGAENLSLARTLREAGIPVLEACTLVLLSSDRF